MKAQDIIDIINALPIYIQYFYPGYLMIYSYLFFKGKEIRNSASTVVMAIAFSYIQIEFLKGLKSIECVANFANMLSMHGWLGYGKSIALLIVSFAIALIAFWVTKSSWIDNILSFLGIATSFTDDEIEALIGKQKGAWIVVYLKNENIVYEGSITGYNMDELSGKRYIRLVKYQKYTVDANGNKSAYIEDYETNGANQVIIYDDDVKRNE